MGYVVMYWLNYKENRNFFLNYLILYIFWKRKKIIWIDVYLMYIVINIMI